MGIMAETISCPKCGQSIDPSSGKCAHCGVNLALAAVLAEQKMRVSTGLLPDIHLSPEVLVPRLGDSLTEQGLLTPDELFQALSYQKKMADRGQPKLIGQALLELNLISREALDQAITEQILQLQSALRAANAELEKRVRDRTVELEHALTRLAELNQLKSNFISNVSHELRTPLTHLRGYIELLGEEVLGPLNSQQLDAIRVMEKADIRLGGLIEDLIQFSAYSQGSLDMRLIDTNLADIFYEVSPKASKKCEEKEIIYQERISQNLPLVSADPQKLPWALLHLIDNAVKFTESGGRVQLGASMERGFVKIYILDTGIGISKEHISEIFEPFHQVDGSSTRRYGGTGLGLAMSQQIITGHGSKIIVHSKVGEGSYFEFSLPIAEVDHS
jgi:signal transduction histidine kinase